jgi:fermentation-respiration switch protein FrsA (DUF1100 family)
MRAVVTAHPSWRQRLKRWCVLLVLGYLGALAVLVLLENWMLYKPAGPDEWAPLPSSQIQDVNLASATGDKIHGWWFPHKDSPGALIYFHGNAGNLSWWGSSMLILQEMLGEPVLIIDYPGYGKSSGAPSENGCYTAADAAYNWLTKTQGIAAESIVICGESLGGGVAVDLASRKPHKALILIKTFTSAPDVGQNLMWFMPVRWQMRNQFNSLSKIRSCTQPVFITNGDADQLVPFSQGERLFEAVPGKKQFFRLRGSDHNDPLPRACYFAMKQFLAESSAVTVPSGN